MGVSEQLSPFLQGRRNKENERPSECNKIPRPISRKVYYFIYPAQRQINKQLGQKQVSLLISSLLVTEANITRSELCKKLLSLAVVKIVFHRVSVTAELSPTIKSEMRWRYADVTSSSAAAAVTTEQRLLIADPGRHGFDTPALLTT